MFAPCATGWPRPSEASLLLRVLADLTVELVAESLGKTVVAVKALQRRGLVALRDVLDPEGVDACLSSIFGMAANLPGVATGGIPGLGSGSLPSVGSLNLAACVPFGTLGTIPGLSGLSGLLPH